LHHKFHNTNLFSVSITSISPLLHGNILKDRQHNDQNKKDKKDRQHNDQNKKDKKDRQHNDQIKKDKKDRQHNDQNKKDKKDRQHNIRRAFMR
jgi:negative regulator of genetic competence, sporulation and motility